MATLFVRKGKMLNVDRMHFCYRSKKDSVFLCMMMMMPKGKRIATIAICSQFPTESYEILFWYEYGFVWNTFVWIDFHAMEFSFIWHVNFIVVFLNRTFPFYFSKYLVAFCELSSIAQDLNHRVNFFNGYTFITSFLLTLFTFGESFLFLELTYVKYVEDFCFVQTFCVAKVSNSNSTFKKVFVCELHLSIYYH